MTHNQCNRKINEAFLYNQGFTATLKNVVLCGFSDSLKKCNLNHQKIDSASSAPQFAPLSSPTFETQLCLNLRQPPSPTLSRYTHFRTPISIFAHPTLELNYTLEVGRREAATRLRGQPQRGGRVVSFDRSA